MERDNTTKPKKKKSVKKRLRTLAIVLCVLVGIGFLVVSNAGLILEALGIGSSTFHAEVSNNKKYNKLMAKENLYNDLDASAIFQNQNIINVLVFGMDRNTAREDDYSIFRPDTIMLASVDIETQKINIISIPRDSRVPIYSRGGSDKINSCFYYGSLPYETDAEMLQGGLDCLKGTVSELFNGIPIHYYVGVDMDGVPAIIDELGGVYTDVHTDIYKHNSSKLLVEEGERTLTGKEFINYARCRDYVLGDIDRVSVQQKLIKALFKELVSFDSLLKLPKVISQTFDIMITDMEFKQMASLAYSVKDFSSEDLNTATVPGNFQNLNKVSYWKVNEYALDELVDEMYSSSFEE